MPNQRKARRYATYGNVAYDLDYLDHAVLDESARRVRQPKQQPLVRPHEQPRTRTRVETRPQERIAPMSVAGFLAVAAMAVLLLMGHAQLDQISRETVSLKNQLSTLQTENSHLIASYEEAFDLAAIQEQVTQSGAMVKPDSSQIIYMDLSEPDNSQVFEQGERTGFGAVLDSISAAFAAVVEYFQ